MNLRYIYLGCDYSFSEEFEDIFSYNTRFISNWMSQNVRKLKIPTDGTFNHINVVISTNEDSCKRCAPSIFEITIHWTEQDIKEYQALRDENKRIQLYLDLLRKGLVRVADYYDIHIDELLSLINVFQQNGCKNEWLLRSMFIKEWNVRLKFTCHFSTSDFRLKLTLYDKKKNPIAERVVFRIYPDEVFFSSELRKVIVEDNKLYINDFLDKHFMSFDLNLLKDGIIEGKLLDDNIKKYIYESNVEKYDRIQWLQ